MLFVRLIICVMIGLDAYWAWWADRQLRAVPWPRRGPGAWRVLSAAFVASQVACLLLVMLAPHFVRGAHSLLPTPALASAYLWHLLVLPVAVLLPMAGRLARSAVLLPGQLLRLARGAASSDPSDAARPPAPAIHWQARGEGLPPRAANGEARGNAHAGTRAIAGVTPTAAALTDFAPLAPLKPAPPIVAPPTPAPLVPAPLPWSRRRLLRAAAVAAPVAVLGAAVAKGLGQIGRFRVRAFTLRLPQLPAALDGLTIAHVSDTHVGRFMRPEMLVAVVDRVNRLGADLVLLTGDLIDFSIDDLPPALDHVRALRAKHGLAMILGNHDLIEDGPWFVAETRAAGVPLLVDGTSVVPVFRNDRWSEVQLLGANWYHGDEAIDQHFDAALRPQRASGAFPIVLAHHPHAFDPAAAAGFPLVLSGHTHGGQLMLTPDLGAGPMVFRYWSGLYQKGEGQALSQLVVSNGVGNWFPLRVNAPAEVVHLTLRREGGAR